MSEHEPCAVMNPHFDWWNWSVVTVWLALFYKLASSTVRPWWSIWVCALSQRRSNVCKVCLLWQIRSCVKCCCPVLVLQTCRSGNLTFYNRHLLNVPTWTLGWDKNCSIRKEGDCNYCLWWYVFLHLMQHLMFWIWKLNTGKGTKWAWWVKTFGEGCRDNIVQPSCQKIKKQMRKQSLQSHRDAAHYIIFCINILCSHILFPYLLSLHKKCFWSLWHMQTLVQSEFLIPFHLPECFFFGTV